MTILSTVLFFSVLSSNSWGQEPDNIVEGVYVPQHDCDAQMNQLDAAVEADPNGLGPRMARAECLYRVGRYEWVRKDLAVVLDGRTIEQVVAESGSQDQAGLVENTAVIAVIMWLHENDAAQARSFANQAKANFGDTPAMARMDIALTAEDDPARAWEQVDTALSRWPDDLQITQAAAEMASWHGGSATQAASAVLDAPGLAATLYNQATRAYNIQDFEVCLTHVDDGVNRLPTQDHARLLRIGYSCAVGVGDLDRTNAFVVALGDLSGLPTDSVIRHAELLYQKNRMNACMELLRYVRPEDAGQLEAVETLKLRIHTKKGRLDEAIEVAARGKAKANSIANLALALIEADRTEDARTVLEPACRRMVGEDAQRCYGLIERLDR